MKQRITIEQLNELTDDQKQRLREWWNPQEGDFIISQKDERVRILGRPLNNGAVTQFYPRAEHPYDTDLIDIKICSPLLSIGQMIELLTTNIPMSDEYQILMWKNPKLRPHIRDWNVEYFIDPERENHECHNYQELCDALWKAVKSII